MASDWQLPEDAERRQQTVDPDTLYPGARRFGVRACVRHLVDFGRAYTVPLVSVGSGRAWLEWAAFGDDDARCVCVDPAPRGAVLMPQHATVEELVASRPELVGACTVLCCWCLPNDSTYDAEAVRLLRPLAVLTLVERFGGGYGAAGGARFHAFLEDPTGYRLVHTTSIEGARDDDGVQWIWLERDDQPLHRPDLPTRAEPRCAAPDECSIC